MIIALVFISFLFFMFLGLPLFAAIGIAPLTAKMIDPYLPYSMQTLVRWGIGGGDSTPAIAIPMFILAGVIMSKGGISEKIFNIFAYFIGDRKSGLPSAAIITSMFYGAITGSAIATTAAVGAMTIPLLKKLGYNSKFIAAMVATAGGLGVIIPPSIPFIFYGMMTGVSVGNMFIAGILPGILIAVSLILYTNFYHSKINFNMDLVLEQVTNLRKEGFINLFKDSFWALLSPIIILGGIYGGIVTPTEAAVVSVVYSLLISITIYKTIKVNEIIDIIRDSIKQFAPTILILALATALVRTLTVLDATKIIGTFIHNYFNSKASFMIAVILLMLVLGMFMDTGPAIVILGPILAPVASSFGIDAIHLGVVMVSCLAIGMVTPPFGLNLFISARILGDSTEDVIKEAIPFIITFIIALLIIAFVPNISLILINLLN